MIRLIVGQPGSGKTYYALYYMYRKGLIVYDKGLKEWIVRHDVVIVSNIDELQVDHVSFDLFYEKYLLPNRYEEKLKTLKAQGKKVVFVIDECQKYFGSLRSDIKQNAHIWFFFEYHRHWGIDIFLITQSLNALPKRLVNLCEYYIEMFPLVLRWTDKAFRAKKRDVTGLEIEKLSIPLLPEIFKLYKSFQYEGSEKPRPAVRNKLILGLLGFFIPLFLLVYLIKMGILFASGSKKTEKFENKQVVNQVVNQDRSPNNVQKDNKIKLYMLDDTPVGFISYSK